MATAYTPILKLALPVTGELNGTWGTVVNDNITSMVEQAVAGLATINTWTANSHTLTTANGTTSESRCAMLVIDDDGAGNPSAAATVICPNATKPYIVQNICGQTVTVKTSAGTGVAIPNNQSALVFCNGTNVVTGAFNGDVVGPASATDNAIVRYDGATGKLIQNSAVTIDDSNNVSGVVQLNATTVAATTGNITTVNATTVNATTVDTTNIEVTNLKAKDGTAAATIADSTGVVTISTQLNVDNLRLDGNTVSSTDTNGNIDLTPNGVGEVNITKVDIDSGTIDGTVIGGVSAAAGTFTTATATTGNITTVNATTVNATTLDATNLEVTNLKAKDGTTAGSIADSTGVVTLASSVLTTTDINGGTIDNTTIGASTPSTIVATQVDIVAQGDLRLQDTTGGQFVALQAPGTIATSYTLTLPIDDGISGQALITDGVGVLAWSFAGVGDVVGPASSTDNAIARFDGTTGEILQNSVVTIADTTGNMTGVGTLGVGAITTTGALTYGGVTLNNAVTGTGNMVLSTSPTLVTPALGTPASGVVTNLTGTASININGTVGATTPNTGAFTTLSSTGNTTLGDATSDLITANARFNTDLVPSTDNARDLGTTALKWKQVFATTFTENGSPVVVQTDIGSAPNEIPLNQYLGSMAYQDRTAVNIGGGVATLGTATVTSIQNDTAISNVEPSLMLNFAAVEALDPRITYTRASTATYYNGVTTAVAEQNLTLYSQEFDQANWSKGAVTVTANSTAAPDGTTTADTVIPTATTATHQISSNTSIAGIGVNTLSVYAKANGYSYIQLMWGSGTDYANFFLSASGSVSQNSGGSPTITSVGNGWYRCSITSTLSVASAIYALPIQTGTETRFASTTGDGTSGIFIWGAQLEQRSAVSAYTPTTTQTITNYIPVLLTAASGVPRFDHNPISGDSLGFLVEQQSTNLVTYSSEFDNAAWGKSNVAVTANTLVAPDGALSADTVTVSTTAINSGITKIYSVGVGNTVSVYAKAGASNFLGLSAETTAWWANFNLSTGTVGNLSGCTATIVNVGNGWYRCIVTTTASSNYVTFCPITTNTTAYGWGASCTAGNSIYIWGAQLEATAFPTSYIATVASQVTRAADAASMTGTNFSSWYSPGEGTLYVESQQAVAANFGTNTVSLVGANTNLTRLGGGKMDVFSNGTTVASLTSAVTTGLIKHAGVYKVNDFALATNGGTVVTDASGAVPIVTSLEFSNGVGFYPNGTIKKLAYYPRRLSNEELQEMTS